MRGLLVAVLMLVASVSLVHAQSGSNWQIAVWDQACDHTDPYVGSCSSGAWVTDTSNGEIFSCWGYMRSGGPTSQPPHMWIACERFPSPMKGTIAFAAPRPTILPCCDQKTKVYTDFVYYYWVIGRTINDLRFCYTLAKDCSGPPVMRALDAREADQTGGTTPSRLPFTKSQ